MSDINTWSIHLENKQGKQNLDGLRMILEKKYQWRVTVVGPESAARFVKKDDPYCLILVFIYEAMSEYEKVGPWSN